MIEPSLKTNTYNWIGRLHLPERKNLSAKIAIPRVMRAAHMAIGRPIENSGCTIAWTKHRKLCHLSVKKCLVSLILK